MIESTIVFVAFFVCVGLLTYYLYKQAQKDPKLKGLEPAALLARAIIKYNFTYLIGLQLSALIAEAALLGSVQDEKTNVTVRMSVHLIAAAISTVGAFGLAKAIGEFVSVFVIPRPIGVRMGLGSTILVIILISFIFAVGAPIVNMLAMANAVHNTGQLECFWVMMKVKMGFLHPSFLTAVIAENRYPPTFSPFANLHSAMMSSVIITTFHLLLTIYEVVLALKLSLTKEGIQHALNTDMFDVPAEKKEEKKEDKKEDKKDEDKKDDEKKDNDPKKVNKKATDQITTALEFLGIDKPQVWMDKILPYYIKMDDAAKTKAFAGIVEINMGIKTLESGKPATHKGITKPQLQVQIRETLQGWTKDAITLPSKSKN
jgi:hypothetical protein